MAGKVFADHLKGRIGIDLLLSPSTESRLRRPFPAQPAASSHQHAVAWPRALPLRWRTHIISAISRTRGWHNWDGSPIARTSSAPARCATARSRRRIVTPSAPEGERVVVLPLTGRHTRFLA